jgi:hypothetical protein
VALGECESGVSRVISKSQQNHTKNRVECVILSAQTAADEIWLTHLQEFFEFAKHGRLTVDNGHRISLWKVAAEQDENMTAAYEQQHIAKQSARLRSMAEQVARPVVAGKRSHRALTKSELATWGQITDEITLTPIPMTFELIGANSLADMWKEDCKSAGIGYTKPLPVVGWIFPIPGFWLLFGKLLLQLALMWIEANRSGGNES